VRAARTPVKEEQAEKRGGEIFRPLLSFVSFGRTKKGAKKPR